MDYEKLASLLFGSVDKSPEYWEEKYPPRDLPKEAMVTRLAPSPTGFIHLGNLYGALADERMAHQSGGVFYLRIEDTDKKREVENGVEIIIKTLKYFNINFDEGEQTDGFKGEYGPYRQQKRKEIYQTYVKELVKNGRAYPCFCTEEELAEMRERQEAQKLNFGYYGSFAKYRDASFELIEENIKKGLPYVVRFKSMGNIEKRVEVEDLIRGTLNMPQNDQDIVILKSDGIPTYHFAHAVDDHLMHTTHVVRGEEWLATLPVHIELFEALGFKMPKYAHTAQLMKMDGESKRKLSKRKDPELSLDYYRGEGYLPAAVLKYLMTVLNSNFEDYTIANPDASIYDFKFSAKKMSISGSLFDLSKLNDVSKDILCVLDAEDIYTQMAEWALEFDKEFYGIFTKDKDFTIKALSVGKGGNKPRKDLINWRQAKDFLGFYYDELFKIEDELPENIKMDEAKKIIDEYLKGYNHKDEQSVWFDKIRQIAEQNGYASQMKDYKKNPENYKGHIGDVSAVLRLGITGRLNSPDFHQISQIIGENRARKRLEDFCKSF